jgi:hypothetical protein
VRRNVFLLQAGRRGRFCRASAPRPSPRQSAFAGNAASVGGVGVHVERRVALPPLWPSEVNANLVFRTPIEKCLSAAKFIFFITSIAGDKQRLATNLPSSGHAQSPDCDSSVTVRQRRVRYWTVCAATRAADVGMLRHRAADIVSSVGGANEELVGAALLLVRSRVRGRLGRQDSLLAIAEASISVSMPECPTAPNSREAAQLLPLVRTFAAVT